jgi:hypothetical protein
MRWWAMRPVRNKHDQDATAMEWFGAERPVFITICGQFNEAGGLLVPGATIHNAAITLHGQRSASLQIPVWKSARYTNRSRARIMAGTSHAGVGPVVRYHEPLGQPERPMQRIITENQIPTGDFRQVKYVGAIKDRIDDGNSVPVWTIDPKSPFAKQVGMAPIESWTEVLIDVEDPNSPETLARLKRAVEARLVQQLG